MDRDRVRIEIRRIANEPDAQTAARSMGAWLCMQQIRRNSANLKSLILHSVRQTAIISPEFTSVSSGLL